MNNRNLPISKYINRSISVIFCLGTLSQPSFALPKPSKESKINALQSYAIAQDPVLQGAGIIADDTTDTIYISPSSKKSQAGVFQPVATPACDVLNDYYDMTYLMPNVPLNEYVEFARKGPYSPFFDAKLGNYVRQVGMLNRIATKMEEIDRIRGENRGIVEAYEEIRLRLEQAQAEYLAAEAAYYELNKNILSLMDLLRAASDAEEKSQIEIALSEARNLKETEGPERKERLRVAIRTLAPLKPAYARAKAAYDVAVPSIESLKTEIASLELIFETIHKLSVDHFSTNERALQAFESTTVGTASASYSIWGDEEARLRNVLASYTRREPYFSKHSVSRLPIHNIRLKKPSGNVVASKVSGSFNGETSMTVGGIGASDNGLNVGDSALPSEYPIFTKEGQLVTPEIKTLSGDGVGTYNNLVTRGAFCTGSTKRYKWPVHARFNDGKITFGTEFDVYAYKPRTANVLAQSVALEYDFYVRSEPIGANCTMDIAKFRSFAVDSGSSGVLFWRHSWSDTERKQMDRSGIVCNILMSPTGENPDYIEQAKRVESIRQTMMQEIAAEFIFTYAKRWDISQTGRALPKSRDSAFRAGVALETLCGLSPMCSVTAIVLKSGDELFGSHADRIRNRDYLSGAIRRAFDETSWTLSNGSAVVDLLVKI